MKENLTSEKLRGFAGYISGKHWHIISTHFPLSLFMTSAGFMILHLFTHADCFDLTSYLTLAAGAVAMFPTTVSGWLTWHGRYKGAQAKVFLYKARIAYAMTALSVVLVIWHAFLPGDPHTIWHYTYTLGITLLLAGAFAEGEYGSRLTHR